MALSFPPQLTGDNSRDIIALQSYLYDLVAQFDNAAGEAIDPSSGQGGDGSLTITEAPTGITYSAAVGFSRDSMMFGEINITFILPARAIGVLVHYRETDSTVWHTSFASTSPYSLQSLKVGSSYNIALAGQAANGALGPLSAITSVSLPVLSLSAATGKLVPFEHGDDELPYMLPGAAGLRGPQGLQGPPGFDAEPVEETWIVLTAPVVITI